MSATFPNMLGVSHVVRAVLSNPYGTSDRDPDARWPPHTTGRFAEYESRPGRYVAQDPDAEFLSQWRARAEAHARVKQTYLVNRNVLANSEQLGHQKGASASE